MAVFGRYEVIPKGWNTRDHLAGNGHPGHALGVPTQDTLRMGTVKVKQDEETDTRIIIIE